MRSLLRVDVFLLCCVGFLTISFLRLSSTCRFSDPHRPLMVASEQSRTSCPTMMSPIVVTSVIRSPPRVLAHLQRPYSIYCHIPKTSGSSVRVLYQEMARSKGWQLEELYNASLPLGPHFGRIIIGHRVREILGQLEGKNYTVAMLRKPFQRILSEYKHHLRDAMERHNKQISFSDVYSPGSFIFCNTQWSMLFGVESTARNWTAHEIDRFLDEATSDYLTLLLYERRRDSYALLNRSMSFIEDGNNLSERKNTTYTFDVCEYEKNNNNRGLAYQKIPEGSAHISLQQIQELENCNRLDFALYRYAELKFEQLMSTFSYSCIEQKAKAAVEKKKTKGRG